MERLLAAAGDEVLPYLVLGAFAGVRTAELMRLTWDCIRFDRKIIEIRAGMAKTAQRRLIPLTDNLAAWLRKVAKSSGPVITLARPEKTASEVIAASCDPVIPWKRNGLRHSYASYRLAILQDAGKLALEMGNSPTMIFSNYRELVEEEDAKKWFALFPKTKDEDAKKEKAAG
jgi:integrase